MIFFCFFTEQLELVTRELKNLDSELSEERQKSERLQLQVNAAQSIRASVETLMKNVSFFFPFFTLFFHLFLLE